MEFLRRITRSRKSTPKYILYAELGRYPLEITIKQRMINFLGLNYGKGKISKLSYNMYLFYTTFEPCLLEMDSSYTINYEQHWKA